MKKFLTFALVFVMAVMVASVAKAADIKTLGGAAQVISASPVYCMGVNSVVWTSTASGIHFYNATTAAGATAANFVFSITPTAADQFQALEFVGYTAPGFFGKTVDFPYFSSGLVVSATAATEVMKGFFITK